MKQSPNHFKLLIRAVKACRLDRATRLSRKSIRGAVALPKATISIPSVLSYGTITLIVGLVLSGVMVGQDRPTGISSPVPQLPDTFSAQLKDLYLAVHASQTVNLQKVGEGRAQGFPVVPFGLAPARPAAPAAIRRITLQEAQQMAAGANDPMVRLGELQVEAAKQHRLGLQGLYFPNLGAQFDNLHFNKNPGQVATFEGPLGNQHTIAANVFNKNQTVVNLSAVQPVTPLMAIHQLVKIARADENIARSKAGMPVAEISGKVEQNYFELLVAQQELISAEAESKKLQGKWLTASTGTTTISTAEEKDMITAEQAIVVPASKVKELTASLNEMLGLEEGTTLELVPPEPLVENISLTEVSDKAMVANPEVVQAEQTAIKAHAASKISKMEYGPNVAIVGGYANQTAISTIIFPRAVGYLGAIATFTVFDFGKREHGVKEATANAEAADLGVQLTKAKVAASIKNSYFELQRSRQFTQLARRMASATRVVEASYKPDNPEVVSAQAKVEAEMFRAELEYRQALAKLKTLMGER